MSRARDLSKLGNPNIIKADENSVGFGTQVAGNPANASSSLISAGIVTAAQFFGDGSNLEGVASAGLGTAVDDTKDSIGQNIYFTNAELSINANTTVNAPDSSNIAYTQYQQVTVESGSELIIADGDSFIPDVLGIGTALQASTAGAGNGIFGTVFVDNIENAAGRGGPNFPLGITVAGVSTLGGNVSIGGTLTYEDVTNVDSIGVVTARNGIDITGASAGLNASSNLRLKTGGTERVRISSAGLVGIGTDLPGGKVTVAGISASARLELKRTNTNTTGAIGAINWTALDGHSVANMYALGDGDDEGAHLVFKTTSAAASNDPFNAATVERLRITSTGGFQFSNGLFDENVKITAGKLSDNLNIDLENGMVHYFSTQETGTAIPNLRINSSTTLNSAMDTGNVCTVTLITTAAAASYINQFNIDGSAHTVEWAGATTPAAGGDGGLDVNAFTIIKTAANTYKVLGNYTNFD